MHTFEQRGTTVEYTVLPIPFNMPFTIAWGELCTELHKVSVV
jgi:hypothetical protein